MKFTIGYDELETMLRQILTRSLRKKDRLTITACAARVFIDFGGCTAGIESLVLADGSVSVPAKTFRSIIATYTATKHLEFEGGADGLRIQQFRMSVLAWNPTPSPPAKFQVFPVTDLGVIPGQPAGGGIRAPKG